MFAVHQRHGQVEIQVSCDENMVGVKISDQGGGIPMANLESVWSASAATVSFSVWSTSAVIVFFPQHVLQMASKLLGVRFFILDC